MAARLPALTPSIMPLLRLLCCLAFILPATAQPALLTYSMVYPPLHMGSPDSDKAGIADEMLQQISRLAGMSLQIHTVPWRRAQLMASHQRDACVFPLTRIPSREHRYQWVGLLAPGQLRLYGWHDAQPLPSLAAAGSRRITVLAGSSAELRLQQQGLAYSTTHTVGDGLRLLQQNLADYWAVHEVVARYEAYQANVRLRPVASLGTADSWLACHRDYPPAALKALQQAFRQLQDSGDAARILRRYTSDGDSLPVD